jgi:spore maturation protein CgeB
MSQVKARGFEALSCGCCLIEDRNNVTARYFEPGTDYIAWDRMDELPHLIDNLTMGQSYALLRSTSSGRC